MTAVGTKRTAVGNRNDLRAFPPVVGGAVAVDRVLWQNDYFAITDEGLLVKPSRVCIIPKRRLPEVGTEALSFVAAYPIDRNPFVAAVHHALKLLCPEQWPTGLVDPELAEQGHR